MKDQIKQGGEGERGERQKGFAGGGQEREQRLKAEMKATWLVGKDGKQRLVSLSGDWKKRVSGIILTTNYGKHLCSPWLWPMALKLFDHSLQ